MRGLAAFLGKELTETLRTWRVWVLPGILLFVGATSPILAQLTPQILKSVGAGQAGVVITIPEPTYLDAYAQWMKNLNQMVLFAVVISMAGVVSGEKRSGTAILVLTKPVSRTAFVVAKALSGLLLLSVATALGGAVCWAETYALFGKAPLADFAGATGLWLLFAALLSCVMVLLSAAIDGQTGAAGAGLGAYAVLSIAGMWRPLVEFSPAGVMPAAADVLVGRTPEVLVPAVATAALALACVAGAAAVFGRREL